MATFGMFSGKSARGRLVLAGLIVALGVTAGQVHLGYDAGTASAASPKVPVPSFIAGWAVVQPNGALTRGTNVANTGRAAPGIYGVVFGGNVAACTYQATIGLSMPGGPPPGEASVAPLNGNPNAVLVRTYNSAGAPLDLPFHLLVVCS
jgi:hypothetical protein